MIKKITILMGLASASLMADTILGGEVVVGGYMHSPTGVAAYNIGNTGLGTSVDLEKDFGWDDTNDFFFKGYLEHPVPFLPNIKVAYNKFLQEGESNVHNFDWGHIIDFNGRLDASLDLQMYDVTGYYELLDNYISLDLGLTARYLSGDITVTPIISGGGGVGALPVVTDLDYWIPMVYGKARFDIPSTDISLQFEGNGITYENTTFYDFEISARYTFTMGLGIEAGYKGIHIDSEDDLADGLYLDIDANGPYAALVWDF